MKAVVFHDVGDIRLEEVPEPKLQKPADAISRLTASAICGTDSQFVRGTYAGMKEGTVLGHEEISIAEQVGESGRHSAVGDRLDMARRQGTKIINFAKAGTLAIIGVYPPSDTSTPIGLEMNKNLTIRMGNCNHRKYIPHLIELIRSGSFDQASIVTQQEPLTSVLDAYKAFDTRQPGWMKVKLKPQAGNAAP